MRAGTRHLEQGVSVAILPRALFDLGPLASLAKVVVSIALLGTLFRFYEANPSFPNYKGPCPFCQGDGMWTIRGMDGSEQDFPCFFCCGDGALGS